MGRIGQVIATEVVNRNGQKAIRVTAQISAGQNVQADVFWSSSIVYTPRLGDLALMHEVPGSGKYAISGFLDPNGTSSADQGQTEIYSRSSDGQVSARITLSATGAVTVSASELDLNGVKIDSQGRVDIPESLTLAGREIAGHTHPIPGNQGPQNTGENL